MSTPPMIITAGNTVDFTVPDQNYYKSADGWSMKYQLVNGEQLITVDGVPAASGFDFNIKAEVSKTWPVGRFQYHVFAEKGAGVDIHRRTVKLGFVTVESGVLDAAKDIRSHAAKMLDMIEAVLEKRATSDVLKYAIRGRSLERMSVADLIKWRSFYQRELKAENAANGQGSVSRRYRMSFR